jgi:hypothetical protein
MTHEFTTGQTAALWATVALFFAYPLLMRFLAHVVHPVRLELADLGKRLLASPYLSDRRKDAADIVLDHAFDWRIMLLVPFAFPVYIVFRGLKGELFSRDDADITHAETRAAYRHFGRLTVASLAAANPLAALILAVESIVLLPIALISFLFARGKDRRSFIDPMFVVTHRAAYWMDHTH